MNQLPVEVCEEIFKNLPLEGILSARHTCCHWRRIIDGSPALMNRIHLKPSLMVMDCSCQLICAIPARSVTLKDATLLTVDSWWSSIGLELTCLKLENCVISTETLLHMLHNAPKLKILSYACDNVVTEAETNFTLDKLEHLEVYTTQTEILDVFGNVCPRLKHFRFGQQNADRKLRDFLKTMENSLETIQLISVENVLDDVLQLKHLTSLDVQSDTFGNETLELIGLALPKLNCLRVNLQWQQQTLTPSFLNSMPELKSLKIFGQYRLDNPSITLNFDSLDGLHSLEKMHLTRLKPLNLKDLLQKSHHFVDLTLHYCEFNNWSELFALISSLKFLERLDLGKLRIPGAEITVSDSFNTIKYLKITHCYLSKNTLKSFTDHCKKLEKVDLNFKYILDNDIVRSLALSWKKSDELSISQSLDQ